MTSNEEIKKIFSENLQRLARLNNELPYDISKKLGIPDSSIYDWFNGKKMPRMGAVQKLADHFNCHLGDLLEYHDPDDVPESYYMNDEAKEMAKFLFQNPEYRVLFKASRDVPPEDIEFVKQMIERVSKND